MSARAESRLRRDRSRERDAPIARVVRIGAKLNARIDRGSSARTRGFIVPPATPQEWSVHDIYDDCSCERCEIARLKPPAIPDLGDSY